AEAFAPGGRDEGVADEAGDGHGADAAGDGRNRAGDLERLVERDVAKKLARAVRLLDPFLTDVDDCRSRLDPIATHQFWPAYGGDHNVGSTNDIENVLSARVGDGDGAVLTQQQHRHRLADDVGPA